MKQKILVCGDVNGNFRLLFERVEKLNRKKGPFDVLFCVGSFFGPSPSNWQPYQSGVLKVPLLTYILGPNKEDEVKYYPDLGGCELCPNVHYLGKRGILTSSGLKIAYVSGGLDPSESESVRVTESDVRFVWEVASKGKDPMEYVGIDVLLTSAWPEKVADSAGSVEDQVKKASEEGSPLLARLVSRLEPRYHFAALNGIYYERPPYRNRRPGAFSDSHCTRFVALSPLSGKKWMYGAVLAPIEKMKKEELHQRTTDETESPYRKIFSAPSVPEQFFFDVAASERENGRTSRKRKRNFSQDKCWFCLAGGQDLETVICIGTEAYVALPKGGLARRHLMICPVKHLESYLHLPQGLKDEVADMKRALLKYYATKREVPVFFERYYQTSHMQLNAVPVPATASSKLRGAFLSHAAEHRLELVEIDAETRLGDVLRLDTPYLHIELPDHSSFYVRCGKNFPMHFARIVLASEEVLNAKRKVDWKECVLPEEEERELAKLLRKEFSEFYSTE